MGNTLFQFFITRILLEQYSATRIARPTPIMMRQVLVKTVLGSEATVDLDPNATVRPTSRPTLLCDLTPRPILT